ncbi:hypothetical protein ABB37_06372 [Leptomonas pyrrhocoris]|uniref:C3H1-type domain-containing protein n=1 Tax=Leptomonas pyrrhocoris TaxID=157538 RepID=A0A0N0DU07_LEPPY|nr:hypothetical protein ABB37_06372 [Leptomonas pyrrhocoris]KPA78211.1 hypothetical protein ABB37_06372 [Leptomonas pyrrhocoris]|eukprot:XP_015656650.1 hypothetical protein ABB37_06372 [Leptomonas pyrrhocoris]
MSTLTQPSERALFALPHSATLDKNDDTPLTGTENLSSVYTGTDEGSRAPTTDVSDEKHSSSSSSDEKKDEDKWIWVLDPMTRKLRVPLNMLVPTHATSTPGTVPSLCIAFLEGRCRHAWCRQAHVVPSAIPQLRYEALSAPTCCHFHHDPQDITMLTDNFKFVRITGNGGNNELIPAERIACTVGLRRYLVHNIPKKLAEHADPSATASEHKAEEADKEGILELPAKFICRLHLAHRCRYLDDCNNIHICREFEVRLQPPAQMLSSLNSVTTSTRTVNIGDTCYTVTPLAVGDVSDSDFNAIAEAQRINHRNAGTPASTPFWSVAPPLDSAVGGSEGSSPMAYSGAGGAGTFPAVPDYRAAQSTPNGSLTTFTGQSPAFTHAESPSQQSHGFSGHLRIYDVRPKPQTETAASSCASSPAMNPNTVEKAGAGKPPPPKYADCSSPSASVNRSVGLSAGGCLSNSTEGGVSVGTSGANTPLADGGYVPFATRTAVPVRK